MTEQDAILIIRKIVREQAYPTKQVLSEAMIALEDNVAKIYNIEKILVKIDKLNKEINRLNNEKE